MDWELVVAGAAVGVGVMSWWAARVSAKAAGRSADKAGEQVAIMRTQTEIQREHLDAAREANRLAHESSGVTVLNAYVKSPPNFTVTPSKGDGYVVANAGESTAYDVEFDPGNLVWKPSGTWPAEWPSSHAEYALIGSSMDSDPKMLVTYATEPGGEPITRSVIVTGL